MTLTTVELGEVCDFLSGFAFKSNLFSSEPVGLPIIRIRDVLTGSSATFYSGDYQPQFIVAKGDILIGMDGEFNRERWKSDPALLNQRVCKAIAKESLLDTGYLYHALPMLLKKIEDETPFVTVKHLSVAKLKSAQLPLPPLEEQRRIAAILDKASSVMKHTDARLQNFKTFENSLFNHFFGRALEQQIRWDCIPFGELCHRLTVGVVVKPASYYRDTGIPALRSLNVRPGSIEQSNFVYISDEDNKNTLSKSKLSAGDLVFVRSGRPGTCAVIPQNLDGCNAIDLLLATSDTSKIMPEFAASYFNSIAGKALVSSESKGQVQQHFNAGSLKTSIIPVPPIELQEEFCKALSKSKALLGNHNVSLQRLEEIFRSLQQTLLLGQIQ